ncbi:hypothetical protein [Altererythrobacter fulvus]|uniref:hypothetical protein n=1 Tax=Caenibius fulvus TaxID=2126012 RepID=UPI0030161920
MRRRELLVGALAAPMALGLGFGGTLARAAEPVLLLYNGSMPRAARAAKLATAGGAQARATGGEIAALLLRERLFAGAKPVLGITGHSEYVLAADIARMGGRRVVPLMQLGRQDRWLGSAAEEQWRPLLGGLTGGKGAQSAETAFAWLALPGRNS